MRYEKNRKIAGIDEYELYRFLRILALPIIAVIMIIVIVVADRISKKGEEAVVSSEQGMSGIDAASNPDETGEIYTNDFSGYGLEKDSIPEINELVARYQQAKLDGDAQAMYKVFGREDTQGIEELAASLSEEKKAYEAYEDTACYIHQGADDNSYLVYISSNIKFKGIEKAAPSLTWAYVIRNQDGSYYIKEMDKLSEEEVDFVDQASRSEDVRLLDSDMRKKLAAAVVADAKLATLYQLWADIPEEQRNVEAESISTEEESSEDKDDVIHIDGVTTASESTETESVETESPDGESAISE